MTSDAINAIFEGIGACLLMVNVRQLHRDKEVKGFHPGPLMFFASWGLWNCWFYPANELWLSFVGGALLASANLAYVAQVIYYRSIRPYLKLIEFLEEKDTIRDRCPICGEDPSLPKPCTGDVARCPYIYS